ncbi:Hcp family type VI secretion system effector [Rhizobium laguerreae]|uniref:Hcp family type VI secretion system effector n=1 Tax=Rhizobium laguerreae TaxID=1076926 RepID=UPI001C90FA5E|nr:type VI secretion system tube protein Hcp [Rhizobium laguerreae]MBY3347982.1 type VI secretion system tube protein Hcp [Rhizobium laguerreae]MBY3354945.1 type VI secretion system tube protein Hcp [Rhizobium laguerreae]MBY3376250.1 type VI secretion system tube protein Hcp [Rhizobium laguerreae]MBY3431249.1 type VI secretion system tube protein Hcp [Rhizobium laguerreae]MBY3439865.1 type VI secretion system tube protein Hcp [Rhizobium laguerreae]
MKIDSIPGESRKKGHEDQIEVLSWAFGMDQQAAAGHGHGSGAGRVNVRDLHLSKYICKADSALMQHCCNGKHIPEITLYCEKAGGDSTVEYVKIVLKQVLVTSHSVTGATGGDAVSVDVSFNFAEYVVTYTQQEKEGNAGAAVTQGWNVAENQAAA